MALAKWPKQALIWSQAGGSLKADSAGVWWSSIPFKNRIQQIAFIENQYEIEKEWDKSYGDRKNEIVFIGQNMNKNLICSHLEQFLSSKEELKTKKWEKGYDDNWPVERVVPIE